MHPGIGQGRITNNLATFINQVDGASTISDDKSIAMLYELLDSEGLYLGASSSLNVVAAVELAQRLGKGENCRLSSVVSLEIYSIEGSKVVTVLCDGAYRYQSRLFSKKWLETKGLASAIPDHLQKYAVLD